MGAPSRRSLGPACAPLVPAGLLCRLARAAGPTLLGTPTLRCPHSHGPELAEVTDGQFLPAHPPPQPRGPPASGCAEETPECPRGPQGQPALPATSRASLPLPAHHSSGVCAEDPARGVEPPPAARGRVSSWRGGVLGLEAGGPFPDGESALENLAVPETAPHPGPRRHLPALRPPTCWQPAGREWRCSGEVLQGGAPGRCSWGGAPG